MKTLLLFLAVLCTTTASAKTTESLFSSLPPLLFELNVGGYGDFVKNESSLLSKEVKLSNSLGLDINEHYSLSNALRNLLKGLVTLMFSALFIYSLYRYLYKKVVNACFFSSISEVGIVAICNPIINEDRQNEDYMSKEMTVYLGKRVKEFEKKKQYLDKDLSLSVLSAQFGVNSRYVSYYINQNKEKDFATYINELRINYAIYALENKPNFLRYKISYLAEQCGFASHSRFTINFKKVTGVLPSDFMASVKDRQQCDKCDL